MKNRDEILDFVINYKNNKLKRNLIRNKVLEKNEIYIKSIYNLTEFLNEYLNVSINERIYYIQNNIFNVVICKYCGKTKAMFIKSSHKIRDCCESIECNKLNKSKRVSDWHKNMSDEEKNKIRKKIGIANSISYEDRLGKERADELKLMASERNKKRKQTKSEKLKRVNSRKNNNRVWHTEETKQKIRESNSKTMLSEEFKNKYYKIYKDSHIKISNKMKKLIQDGKFTPCITNSWTHWESYLILNNIKIKYRSDWEACFHLLNENLLYEKIRIPYYIDGVFHNYIVDFYDDKNKILYEIKPSKLADTKINIIKFNYCKKWCSENQVDFRIISEQYFIQNFNLIDINAQPQLSKFKNTVKKWMLM